MTNIEWAVLALCVSVAATLFIAYNAYKQSGK